MSHEIETFDDGTAAFFTARTGRLAPPRHHHPRLPYRRAGHDHRQARRLERAHRPADRHRPRPPTGSPPLPVPDHFATVRTHPATGRPDVLGVVGSGYTVVQNEEHCELLNLLVDEAGAHFETAGSPARGSGDLRDHEAPHSPSPSHRPRTGSDDVELYLAAMSSAMTAPPPGGSSSPRCASSAPTPNAWPCTRPRRPMRSGTPAPRAAEDRPGPPGPRASCGATPRHSRPPPSS